MVAGRNVDSGTTFAADTPWLSIARSAVSAASATVRPFRSSRPSPTSAKTERIGISTRPGPSRTVFLSRRWTTRSGNSARRRRGSGVDEDPLVVLLSVVIDAKRRLFASADDPDHTTLLIVAEPDRLWRSALVGCVGRRLALHLCQLGRMNYTELSVLGHRICVQPSEESLLDEGLEIRRICSHVASLVQLHRARILLTSKDKLSLAFTLRGLTPHGQEHRRQNPHDRKCHEKARHRVPVRRAEWRVWRKPVHADRMHT